MHADGLLVVYDVTCAHSFDRATIVLEKLRKNFKPYNAIPTVLVGNKSDMNHSRCVKERERERERDRAENVLKSDKMKKKRLL